MTREEVIRKLATCRSELNSRGVQALLLFGSTARNEAAETSDVDLLVEYAPGVRVGLFDFVRLRRFLSESLGRPVDLVTSDALRGEMKAEILREAIHAA